MKQYHYTDEKNEQQGPIDEDLLIANYRACKYSSTTQVWCEGMGDWQSVTDVMKDLGVEEDVHTDPSTSPPFIETKDESERAGNQPPTLPPSEMPTAPQAKDTPKAKLFSRKLLLIVGVIAALLVAGIYGSSLGVNSADDVQDLMDEKMLVLKSNAKNSGRGGKKIYAEFSANRNEMKLAAMGGDNTTGMVYLLSLLSGFGENDALDYLIVKRGCAPADLAKRQKMLFVCALAGGNTETVRELVELGFKIESKQVQDRLECLVCRFGCVDLLRWLVQEGYCVFTLADVNDLIKDLVRCRSQGYAEILEANALFGKQMDIDQLKTNHLAVVEFLTDQLGGDLTIPSIQQAADYTSNVPLRKKIVEAKKLTQY